MRARSVWRAWLLVACLGGAAAADVLPFRPLSNPGDHFSASDLTIAYETDSSLFLNGAAYSYLDLDELDRHGLPRYEEDTADGSKRVRSESAPDDSVAELSPDEKDEAVPPPAGVQVGIPSYIAVPGTLIGGAALLAKVLSELF